MALCARTACINTPGNLYTCMNCTPLISVDAKGINLDFRFEIKICTHLRGGSDITEQRLCVRICPLVHYALKSSLFLPLQLSIATTSLHHPTISSEKTRRWRKTQHYLIHLPLDLSMNLYGEGEVCDSVFPLFRGSPRV